MKHDTYLMLLLERNHLVTEIDGFSLVGSGKSHYWCGVWQTYGCLKHKQAYVRQFKKTCFRPDCKVCYPSWVIRQSKRSALKLNRMKNGNTLKHGIITINESWNKESKKKLISHLKKNGIESACLIYTPFDETNNKQFFLKNTIHIFYSGLYSSMQYKIYPQNDLDGTNRVLLRILQTQYLNAGIKKGLHFVSWIGKSVYCTLDNFIPKQNCQNCPLCNRKLKLIYYTGEKEPIPPDEYFDGETDKKGWKYCPTLSVWVKLFRKIKRKINYSYSRIIIIICNLKLTAVNDYKYKKSNGVIGNICHSHSWIFKCLCNKC